MTDRPKAKPSSSKSTNDERPNKKAWKKGVRGSKPTRLSAVQKVLLGKGRYLVFNGVGSDHTTQNNKGDR